MQVSIKLPAASCISSLAFTCVCCWCGFC